LFLYVNFGSSFAVLIPARKCNAETVRAAVKQPRVRGATRKNKDIRRSILRHEAACCASENRRPFIRWPTGEIRVFELKAFVFWKCLAGVRQGNRRAVRITQITGTLAPQNGSPQPAVFIFHVRES
jgi:hypothetical protein